MTQDDVEFLDSIVTEFREQLLAVGHMKRINRYQHDALERAYKKILNLPAQARERAKAYEEMRTDGICEELEALARSEHT